MSARPIGATRPDPPVRGGGFLALGDRALGAFEALSDKLVPRSWNPIANAGAVANATFLVACVTGVLLLVWYSSSVHFAHASVLAMDAAPWTSGLVRSLHRYSSDACVLFVLLHATRIFFSARFSGARWLAWVTGVAAAALLWLVGWLGYWLVWDVRAQSIATGSAKLVDVLPIFADPLSRSFLADAAVHSLLFFVVFFAHMLLPLAMAVPLWLHITRLSRPRFLPGRALWGFVLVALVAASLLHPATAAEPARMAAAPGPMEIDGFYLAALGLTDRLGGGALWALSLVGLVIALSVPWALARGRAAAAVVDTSKCNACKRCVEDCPYDAIRMVPRDDGRQWDGMARIDPDRCVGCGVCTGACDSSAIGPPALSVPTLRHRLEAWLDAAPAGSEGVAFVCASSAGRALAVDEATGACAELPGYRVVAVPCTGWVHALTLERALKHGAKAVLVAACGPVEPTYRDGGELTQLRIEGKREPFLRADKVDPGKVRFVSFGPGRLPALRAEASRLLAAATPAPRPRPLAARLAGGAVVFAAASAVVIAGSEVGYAGPPPATELVVSFKHPGKTGERCRTLSAEELAALPPHMRRPEVCERGRSPVRLLVSVDGEVRLDRSYKPQGLSGDGNSLAVERFPVTPGRHRVEVGIADEPGEPAFREAREVEVPAGERAVVLFDRVGGFAWHVRSPGDT